MWVASSSPLYCRACAEHLKHWSSNHSNLLSSFPILCPSPKEEYNGKQCTCELQCYIVWTQLDYTTAYHSCKGLLCPIVNMKPQHLWTSILFQSSLEVRHTSKNCKTSSLHHKTESLWKQLSISLICKCRKTQLSSLLNITILHSSGYPGPLSRFSKFFSCKDTFLHILALNIGFRIKKLISTS